MVLVDIFFVSHLFDNFVDNVTESFSAIARLLFC